jgi:hypothetical protein
MEAYYKLRGYEIKVKLGTNSLKNFEPGYCIELKLPSRGITTHCSKNIAEAILETFAKADLLTKDKI